jgi:DnaK suppressor protein
MMDEKTARELLAQERARIEEEMRLHQRAADRAAERAAEPQDRADSAQIDYGHAEDLARIESLEEEMAALERAEQRLREGTYGLSVESGEPIPDGRLHRLPTTERTVEEQVAFERRGGA